MRLAVPLSEHRRDKTGEALRADWWTVKLSLSGPTKIANSVDLKRLLNSL